MTIEEAIKILDDGEWWCHLDAWYEAENPENIKLHDAVDVAIAALRYQQEAEKKWISVKDRLPEEYMDARNEFINYLCYMPEYGVDIANYVKPVGVWISMGHQAKVTHWMPLPEPPKEG